MCKPFDISLEASADTYAPYTKGLEELLRQIYRNKVDIGKLHEPTVARYFKDIWRQYTDGLGYSFDDLDPKSSEQWTRLARSEANMFAYSAHKNNTFLQAVRSLSHLPVDEFMEAAELLHKTHYARFLEVEKQHARAIGDAQRMWQDVEEYAELMPYLTYHTAEDDRVRPQHASWNKTTLHWRHPFWNSHYPPNGYGCRCIVTQDFELDDGVDLVEQEEKAKKLPKADEGFRQNSGKADFIFHQKEGYFKQSLSNESNAMVCTMLKRYLNGFINVTPTVRVSPAIATHEIQQNIEQAVQLSKHVDEVITLNPPINVSGFQNPDLVLKRNKLADLKAPERLTTTAIQRSLKRGSKQLAEVVIIKIDDGSASRVDGIMKQINQFNHENKHVKEIWFYHSNGLIKYRKGKKGFNKKGST